MNSPALESPTLVISLHKSHQNAHNPGSLLFCPGSLTCKFGLVAAQRGPCVSIPGSHKTKKPSPPSPAFLDTHEHFPPLLTTSSQLDHTRPRRLRSRGRWAWLQLGRLAQTGQQQQQQQSRQPAEPPPDPLSHHHHRGEIRMVSSHFRATHSFNNASWTLNNDKLKTAQNDVKYEWANETLFY